MQGPSSTYVRAVVWDPDELEEIGEAAYLPVAGEMAEITLTADPPAMCAVEGTEVTFTATVTRPTNATLRRGPAGHVDDSNLKILFESGDTGILTLSGGAQKEESIDSATGEATTQGKAVGNNGIVTVTARPDNPDELAAEDAECEVWATMLVGLTVFNASQSAGDDRCYVTTQGPGAVVIRAEFDPPVAPGELPPFCLEWFGGDPGLDEFHRLVTTFLVDETPVVATCGDIVEDVHVHVVDADPLPAQNPDADLTHTLHPTPAIVPARAYGVAVLAPGQQVFAPSLDFTVYLDGNAWAFRVNSIEHVYQIGVHNRGRTDISGPGDPDITADTFCAIIEDLTPRAQAAPPKRDEYWSRTITRAHEQYHADDFYGDKWPFHMRRLENTVETAGLSFDCADANRLSVAAVTALQTPIWESGLDLEHMRAFWESGPGSEVRAHEASNLMYARLVMDIRNSVPPLAPTNLTADDVLPTVVFLSWTDNACSETSYLVHRRSASGPWVTAGSLPSNQEDFTDRTVTPGTTYDYGVVATGVAGNSATSNVVTVTTPSLPPGPGP